MILGCEKRILFRKLVIITIVFFSRLILQKVSIRKFGLLDPVILNHVIEEMLRAKLYVIAIA